MDKLFLILIGAFFTLDANAIHPANLIKEVRVIENPDLPLDPLKIKSMADYNLALLIGRNWFDYDDGRNAKKGLIESWKFDSSRGVYTFQISSKAKWSDGAQITPEELKFNLDRSISLHTTFGDSIKSIVDTRSFKKSGDLTFELQTLDKKPSPSFFERMGSIFLAIVSPKDVDQKTMKVVSNTYSSGPFKITKETKSILLLEKNENFNDSVSNVKSIQINRNKVRFDIDEFLAEKSWNNVYQMTSFVPADWEKKITQKNFPYWSRGHDRISLFRPGFGKRLKKGIALIKLINEKLAGHKFEGTMPFNVTRAYSLQPESYPLFHQKVRFVKRTEKFEGPVHILCPDIPATYFHIERLSDFFKQQKLAVKWDIVPFADYLSSVGITEDHDLVLLNFGVADPEPATWMSLIKQAKFIHLDQNDISQFDKILTEPNRLIEVNLFKELLINSMKKGGYAPLFYASTFALGQRGLSFENIRELDETVDLSKVVFETVN